MTDPATPIDWTEIGKTHAINVRRIEAMLSELEAVSRALHVERCAAEAHAAAVARRAKLAADSLSTAYRHLAASRSIMKAQSVQATVWALEYLLGRRADDDAFQAARVCGWAHPDGAKTRRGIDVLFALATAINATETA